MGIWVSTRPDVVISTELSKEITVVRIGDEWRDIFGSW